MGKTNFIEELHNLIYSNINDPFKVMNTHGMTVIDIVNLCGGIPSMKIKVFNIDISSQYKGAISVGIKTNLYELTRSIDFDTNRIDNNYMLVYDRGNGVGTSLFLNQYHAARKLAFNKLHTTALAPSADTKWYGYYFWANLGFENSDYEEYRDWTKIFDRKEETLSELVQTEEGRRVWKQYGFTWIGDFYLADNHKCSGYLMQHLKRKRISIE